MARRTNLETIDKKIDLAQQEVSTARKPSVQLRLFKDSDGFRFKNLWKLRK